MKMWWKKMTGLLLLGLLSAIPSVGEAAIPLNKNKAEQIHVTPQQAQKIREGMQRYNQHRQGTERRQREQERRFTNPGSPEENEKSQVRAADSFLDLILGTGRNTNVDAVRVASFHGHRYFLYSGVVKTYEEAEAYCELFGGHLATIDSAEENDFICQYSADQFNATKNERFGKLYFGLYDAKKDGIFVRIDGTLPVYTNWRKGQPKQEEGKYYACFDNKNPWLMQEDTWKADKFKKNGAFICEWDTEEAWEKAKSFIGAS